MQSTWRSLARLYKISGGVSLEGAERLPDFELPGVSWTTTSCVDRCLCSVGESFKTREFATGQELACDWEPDILICADLEYSQSETQHGSSRSSTPYLAPLGTPRSSKACPRAKKNERAKVSLKHHAPKGYPQEQVLNTYS